MKISSKGQITIPLRIRNEFGFYPGTAVEFVVESGEVILRAKRQSCSAAEDWLKEATGVARGKMITAKIMKLTRGQT